MSSTTLPAVDEETLRPFLRLADHLPKPFLEQAVAWQALVISYGIDHVDKRPETPAENREFMAYCHDGWKRAQTEIAAFLIGALGERAEADAAEKACKRCRDRNGASAARLARKKIDLQILVARRTLDVILWTILRGEHSSMRRLLVPGGQHSLSIQNIKTAMAAADLRNADRQVMALCSDMLSLVHVGDLLVMNGHTGQIALLELKEGAKNIAISHLAHAAVRAPSEEVERFAEAEMTEVDRKHFARARRQIERGNTVVDTINNEGGLDPNTGQRVVISPLADPPEYWTHEIQHCYEQLTQEKRWAIAAIEGCVYVGVYSDTSAALAFLSWMHVQRCDSRVFNLTDSFTNIAARPLGSTDLSQELKEKILRGEVTIVMCLDVRAFVELGNKITQNSLTLASRKETAQTTQRQSGVEFLTLDGCLIRAASGDSESFMGEGVRDRILFDQLSPSQFLSHHFDFSKRPRVSAVDSTT